MSNVHNYLHTSAQIDNANHSNHDKLVIIWFVLSFRRYGVVRYGYILRQNFGQILQMQNLKQLYLLRYSYITHK